MPVPERAAGSNPLAIPKASVATPAPRLKNAVFINHPIVPMEYSLPNRSIGLSSG